MTPGNLPSDVPPGVMVGMTPPAMTLPVHHSPKPRDRQVTRRRPQSHAVMETEAAGRHSY